MTFFHLNDNICGACDDGVCGDGDGVAYELELVVVEERKVMDHRSLEQMVEMDHRSLEHRMEELDHRDHRSLDQNQDHQNLGQNQDHKDHQSLDLSE